MKNYGLQHSTVKPTPIEITETKVFIYNDIVEIKTNDCTQYKFELIEYNKDEYVIEKISELDNLVKTLQDKGVI